VFFKKFRIPPEVKKALPWTPYLHGCKCICVANSWQNFLASPADKFGCRGKSTGFDIDI
jgi:hypothetical protein